MVTDERSETCDVDDVDGTSDALSMNQKMEFDTKMIYYVEAACWRRWLGGMMAEEQKIDDLKLTRWQ